MDRAPPLSRAATLLFGDDRSFGSRSFKFLRAQRLAVRAVAANFGAGENDLKTEVRFNLLAEAMQRLAEKLFDFAAAEADDVGVFGFAEIIRNLDAGAEMDRDLVQQKITGLMPTKKDLKDSFPAIVRGTILGSILGILPGGGAVIASFAAYTLEKKIAKDPSRFGRGAIEGVAAPESANNAAAQTSFIPLLTLGIPPNAVMALMVGAMTIHGIVPGPQVMQKQPELVWGMIASMWIGNLMLIIINLPLVGIWVRLLRVPYRLMFPCIVIFCAIGIYSVNNAPVDVVLAGVFGLVGYWLIKHDFEPAPLLLGMVLGPLMEENLRRALLISRGDWSVFVTRPLSAVLMATAAFLLVLAVLPSLRKKRDEVFVESEN